MNKNNETITYFVISILENKLTVLHNYIDQKLI